MLNVFLHLFELVVHRELQLIFAYHIVEGQDAQKVFWVAVRVVVLLCLSFENDDLQRWHIFDTELDLVDVVFQFDFE